MAEYTVVRLSKNGETVKIFSVPTPQVHGKDIEDILKIALENNLHIEFVRPEVMGIEALKWEIRNLDKS